MAATDCGGSTCFHCPDFAERTKRISFLLSRVVTHWLLCATSSLGILSAELSSTARAILSGEACNSRNSATRVISCCVRSSKSSYRINRNLPTSSPHVLPTCQNIHPYSGSECLHRRRLENRRRCSSLCGRSDRRRLLHPWDRAQCKSHADIVDRN